MVRQLMLKEAAGKEMRGVVQAGLLALVKSILHLEEGMTRAMEHTHLQQKRNQVYTVALVAEDHCWEVTSSWAAPLQLWAEVVAAMKFFVD